MKRIAVLLAFMFISADSAAFFGPDCDSASDCMTKAENLSNQNRLADAIDFYREACDEYRNKNGCYQAGIHYQFGLGKRKKEQGKELLCKSVQIRLCACMPSQRDLNYHNYKPLISLIVFTAVTSA